MNNIIISDLAGSELFQDSESFLDQLTEQQLNDVQGGAVSAGGAGLALPTVDLLSGIPTLDLVGALPTANVLAGLPTANILFPPAAV